MTQKVGLITYLKIKAKAFFKQRVSPSQEKSSTPHLDDYLKRQKPFNSYKSKTVYTRGANTVKVNGTTYNLSDGDVLTVNGKEYKPGTPEFEEFKKEMDDFDKEMAEFGAEMGRMGREMGQSAEEMAKSMRNLFK